MTPEVEGRKRLLLFSDSFGLGSSLAALRDAYDLCEVVGIVAAANRPQEVKEVQAIAGSWDIPVFVQPFRKDVLQYDQFVKALRNTTPHLGISNSYSMILEPRILSIPKLGVINVHNSLLPQYRGANTMNWTLINGEKKTGVTIHYMDEGVDTGNIIAQERVAIEFTDTAVTLREKLFAVVTSLLGQVVAQVLEGTAPRIPQDESKAQHWPRRRPQDGLIDWSKDTIAIYNLIRALVKPWPGAFYYLPDGRKVVIDTWIPLDEVERLKAQMARDGNPTISSFVSK